MAGVTKVIDKKKVAKESFGWFKRAFSQLVDDVPKDKASDIAKRFINSGKSIRNKALVDAVEREATAARKALANAAKDEAAIARAVRRADTKIAGAVKATKAETKAPTDALEKVKPKALTGDALREAKIKSDFLEQEDRALVNRVVESAAKKEVVKTDAAKTDAAKKVRELEAVAWQARNSYDSTRWHKQSPDIAKGDPARGVWRNYISDPAYDFYSLAAGPSFGASTVTRLLTTGKRVYDTEGRMYAAGLGPAVSNLLRGPVPTAARHVKSAAKWTWNQLSPWDFAFSKSPSTASGVAKKPGKIGSFLTDRRTIGIPTLAGLTYLYYSKGRWPQEMWGGTWNLSKAAGGKVVDFANWVRGKGGDDGTGAKTFEQELSELAAVGPGNITPEQYNELLTHYNELKKQDVSKLSDGDRKAFTNNLDRAEDILVTDPRVQASIIKEAEGVWNEEHGATSLYTFDEMAKEDPSGFIKTVADPLRERHGGSFDKKAVEYYLRSLNTVADPDPVYDF